MNEDTRKEGHKYNNDGERQPHMHQRIMGEDIRHDSIYYYCHRDVE